MMVINLWGAPSSGKSTTAAGLFFLMKINKMRVELVTEFAKDLVWEGRENVFGEQSYIFAEQNHRLYRLNGQVDFAITDSPIPLPVFYMPKGYLSTFPSLVMEQFNCYDNVNILLRRPKDFEHHGRRHSEAQSLTLDRELEVFLNQNEIPHLVFDANPQTPQAIFDYIVSLLPDKVDMTLSVTE